MANNDLDDVKLHATQAFEAVERSYNKISRRNRFFIKAGFCIAFFIGGFVTSSVMNNVPTEGVIEKIAAQPDLKNKCKGRYDRPMEYAIMHECIFAKGTRSPTRRCSKTTSWTSPSRFAKKTSARTTRLFLRSMTRIPRSNPYLK